MEMPFQTDVINPSPFPGRGAGRAHSRVRTHQYFGNINILELETKQRLFMAEITEKCDIVCSCEVKPRRDWSDN